MRQIDRPPEAEGPVSAARVIAERFLRTETRSTRTHRDRDARCSRPAGGVDGKLLAYPADSAAAFGEADRRCGCATIWLGRFAISRLGPACHSQSTLLTINGQQRET